MGITTENITEIYRDDFLFEVEDKGYIISNLSAGLFGVFLLFILLVIHDFDFLDIARGRLGTLVVLVSTPYFIYLLVNVVYHQKFKKKKKIKFYKKFIYFENKKTKIDIINIEKPYCLMFSAGSGEFILHSKIRFYLTFYFVLLAYLLLFISNYILNRTLTIDNIFFLMKNKKLYGGIAYGTLKDTEKEKVKWYFEKYLKQNLDLVESKLLITSDIQK